MASRVSLASEPVFLNTITSQPVFVNASGASSGSSEALEDVSSITRPRRASQRRALALISNVNRMHKLQPRGDAAKGGRAGGRGRKRPHDTDLPVTPSEEPSTHKWAQQMDVIKKAPYPSNRICLSSNGSARAAARDRSMWPTVSPRFVAAIAFRSWTLSGSRRKLTKSPPLICP